MFRHYLKTVGIGFIALGLLTILAPTGGLMVLLGIAMLIQAGLISLGIRAYATLAEVAQRLVAARRRQPTLELPATREALPAPAPNPIHPLHA